VCAPHISAICLNCVRIPGLNSEPRSRRTNLIVRKRPITCALVKMADEGSASHSLGSAAADGEDIVVGEHRSVSTLLRREKCGGKKKT